METSSNETAIQELHVSNQDTLGNPIIKNKFWQVFETNGRL